MVHSRAYLNFRNASDVPIFASQFDGHLFVDEAARESKALVEYAPSQRIPRKSKNADAKINTYSTDPEFQKFEQSLQEESVREGDVVEKLVAQLGNDYYIVEIGFL